MRLQPTINLLEIPFNTNMARDIMQEKHAASTQLLYQMFIALTNKEKKNLTGATMETMRPSAIVRLENYESKIYEKVRTNYKYFVFNFLYFIFEIFKRI